MIAKSHGSFCVSWSEIKTVLASIREIAELVGGRLDFGPMPPLDGANQFIERIVPSCQNVRAGEVVLWCGDFSQPLGLSDASILAETSCFLEEAFARGALGVIAARHVAPWPGRFCLQVDDPREALSRIAERQQKQAVGKRVLVVDPLVPSPVFHVLCQATQQQASDIELAFASDVDESVRWQLIGLDTARTHTLIHTIELPNLSQSHEFSSDVVVFTGGRFRTKDDGQQALSKDAFGLAGLRHVAAGASIVCPEYWHDEIRLLGKHLNVITYGEGESATVRGHWANGQLAAINGTPASLASCWSGIEYQALAAVAAARAIGLNERSFVDSFLERTERRRAS